MPFGPNPAWWPPRDGAGQLPMWAPRAWRLPSEARWRVPEEWSIPAPDSGYGRRWWHGHPWAPGGHPMWLRMERDESGELAFVYLVWGGQDRGSPGDFFT